MKDYNKTKLLIILLVASLIFSLFTLFVSGEDMPRLSARSAALYECSGDRFLYTKNAEERLPMASTTKIMTALIAIERADLKERVTAPKEAVGIEGSSIYLKENDTLTVKDLVYSVLLQSANDAATALALKIGGDLYSFAEIMNERAKEIGLTDTNFENPHGLDSENHYTTAKDLALLAAEALKNPTFKKICSTYKYDFQIGEAQRVVVNHNKLLKRVEGAIGVKTGFTKKSGRCLVGACERDGIVLVSVTLNAPDDWSDHEKLFNYGYSRLEAVSPLSLRDVDFTLPVLSSDKTEARVTVKDASLYKIAKLKGEVEIDVVYECPNFLVAPKEAGEIIGRAVYKQDGKILLTLDITLGEELIKTKEKRGFFPFFK